MISKNKLDAYIEKAQKCFKVYQSEETQLDKHVSPTIIEINKLSDLTEGNPIPYVPNLNLQKLIT